MLMHLKQINNKKLIFFYGLPAFIFFIIIIIEWMRIIDINDGYFVYTLDDPYIHLRLAQFIRNGFYGLYAGEFSSPSSSILWPFLLVPFAKYSFYVYLPLILNTFFSLVIIWAISFIILHASENKLSGIQIFMLIIGFLISCNLVGLAYTGMEHELQIMLSVLCLLGLLIEASDKKIPLWLPIVIIAGPLVRYENLSLSIPTLIYLFLHGYKKISVLTFIVLSAGLAAFSLFVYLHSHTLLPASVMLKGNMTFFSSLSEYFSYNLITNLYRYEGMKLLLFVTILIVLNFLPKLSDQSKQISVVIISAIVLHLFFGRLGWYYRYGMYLYVTALLWITYLCLTEVKQIGIWKFTALLISILMLSYPYIKIIMDLPLAPHNIYLQQQQMRKFAVDILKRPVAVNDIGLVSYNNPNYVLDFMGLGNAHIQSFRYAPDPNWKDDLARQKNVKIVMIYKDWFSGFPQKWQLLGCLYMCHEIAIAQKVRVHFYNTEPEFLSTSKQLITTFQSQLPDGAVFGDCQANLCELSGNK